jgi:hypothetical protein
MIFWHAALVRWIVFWKQGVEKTTEFAFAYETNVANLHRFIRVPWTWLPQRMSVQGIFDGKLFAENIAVGHWGSQESRRTTQRPEVRVRGPVCGEAVLPRISHMTRTMLKRVPSQPSLSPPCSSLSLPLSSRQCHCYHPRTIIPLVLVLSIITCSSPLLSPWSPPFSSCRIALIVSTTPQHGKSTQ